MQRRTRQRDAVWRAFEEAKRPLSPAECHQHAREFHPGLGLRTVYRHLQEWIREGRLVGIDYPGQPLRYERVTDRGARPHFLCRSCNRTFELDVQVPDFVPQPPPGFLIEGEELIFFGRCPACARRGAESQARGTKTCRPISSR